MSEPLGTVADGAEKHPRNVPSTACSVALSASTGAFSLSEFFRAFSNLGSFATEDGMSTVAVRITRSGSPHSIPPNRSLNSSMKADSRSVSISDPPPAAPDPTGSISASASPIVTVPPGYNPDQPGSSNPLTGREMALSFGELDPVRWIDRPSQEGGHGSGSPQPPIERIHTMILGKSRITRVVATLCMLSFTSMLTSSVSASALPVADVPPASSSADTSMSSAGICALNSRANGSTYTGVSTTPCWLILIGVGAICAGCVGTVLNPVPGDEIIVCEACLTAILAAEAQGCFQ